MKQEPQNHLSITRTFGGLEICEYYSTRLLAYSDDYLSWLEINRPGCLDEGHCGHHHPAWIVMRVSNPFKYTVHLCIAHNTTTACLRCPAISRPNNGLAAQIYSAGRSSVGGQAYYVIVESDDSSTRVVVYSSRPEHNSKAQSNTGRPVDGVKPAGRRAVSLEAHIRHSITWLRLVGYLNF